MITLHGIPNCDTVKRARAWLQARGVPYRFHDFKRDGLPAGQPGGWLAALGHQQLVNRQGTTWRRLDDETRQRVTDDAAARPLIEAQPSLLRRPVVQWADGQVTVGFDQAQWLERLAAAGASAGPQASSA